MSSFTIWTVSRAVTCESGRASSPKPVYFGISKILNFSYFMCPCPALFTVYFHTVTSLFRTSIYAVFAIDGSQKQTLLTKLFDFVFTKGLPSISQLNTQALKEEQYTLSNMIYIKLTNCCFISLEVCFKALKMYTNQLNSTCNGIHFFVCSFLFYQKYSSLQLRFLIRFLLQLSIFEILQTSVSQKTF